MSYQVRYRQRHDPLWFSILFYGFMLVLPVYAVWRSTLINWHIWYGPLLFLAELYGFITTGLFMVIARRRYDPVRHVTALKPTVDILIPTYNESLDVLEPVVRAATAVRGARRVLVLDDGNRNQVETMARAYGADFYPRRTNTHAKAGNLNNGLSHTDAEFLVLLDADHIALPDLIEQTIGYFDDRELAFVQSPQTFYNTDSFLFRRRLGDRADWSEQQMFYDCIQPAKNRWNAAFFVGTGAVIRRQALDDVAGFATGTATEDIHTSLRLHAAGWKSLFLPRVLAYGLEAASFREFYKQRKRWAAGSLGLLLRSSDSPLRARGLSPMQRLNYLSATLAHLQGVQKLCFFVVPILTLLWGQPPITTAVGLYSLCFSGMLLLSVLTTWVFSRGTYHPFYSEVYAIANMWAHFGGLRGVIKVQKKFAVSNKLSPRRERTWALTTLWVLLVLSVAAFGRGAWLYLVDDKHYGLFIYSCAFIALNIALLASFLSHLFRYERSTATTAPAVTERSGLPTIDDIPALSY